MSNPERDLSTDELRRMLAAIDSRDTTGDLTMRIWIAGHPNVPREWVDKVLSVRFVAARRTAERMLTVAGLPIPFDAGRDSGVYRALAGNPSVTAGQLREIWRLRPMFTYPGSAAKALSTNPNTPADVIEDITMFLLNKMSPPHGSWPLPADLISHPNQPDRSGTALAAYLLSITDHPDLGVHATKALMPLLAEERTAHWLTESERSRLLVAAAFLC